MSNNSNENKDRNEKPSTPDQIRQDQAGKQSDVQPQQEQERKPQQNQSDSAGKQQS